MGRITNAIAALRGTETRNWPPHANEWFRDHPGSAGVSSISDDEALSCTAVLAAVRLLSETVAMIPLHLYQREDIEGMRNSRRRAVEHPVYSLVHDDPNPEMTPFEVFRIMMAQYLIRGNAITRIIRTTGGAPAQLWPLRADKIRISRNGGRLVYTYTRTDRQAEEIPAENIIHIKNFHIDGLIGLALKHTGARAISTAIEQERFYNEALTGGENIAGWLKFPGHLKEEVFNEMMSRLRHSQSEIGNNRIRILDNGGEWAATGITPEDAMILDGRTFQIQEVARLFNLSPHMLQDHSRSTFNNIEHLSILFVKYTIGPILENFQQALGSKLLTKQERGSLWLEFLTDSLLKGDIRTRYEAMQKAIQSGWMSRNEARDRENMPPVDGGDIMLVPVNMTTPQLLQAQADAAQAGTPSAAPAQDGDAETKAIPARIETRSTVDDRKALRDTYMPIFFDAAERLVRAQIRDLRKSGAKNLPGNADIEKFLRDAEALYTSPNQLPANMNKIWRPILGGYAEAMAQAAAKESGADTPDLGGFADKYLDVFRDGYLARKLNEIKNLMQRAQEESADAGEVFEQRMDEWNETGAEKMAKRENVQLGEAVAVAAMIAIGKTIKRWRTSGESCPLCSSLNGKVASIEGPFIPGGGSVAPEGVSPLNVKRDIMHPPLHRGCDCMVVAD